MVCPPAVVFFTGQVKAPVFGAFTFRVAVKVIPVPVVTIKGPASPLISG
jgi:hypothetical protein